MSESLSIQQARAQLAVLAVRDQTLPGVAETVAQLRALLADLAGQASVTDYGAIGDGVTDDTAAIQAALNSDAGTVLLPPGRYAVSVPLVVRNRKRLVGAANDNYAASSARGCGIVALAGFVGAAVIESDTSVATEVNYQGFFHYVEMSDFYIDCNNVVGVSGIRIHQMGEECVLESVSVWRAKNSGFLLTGVHAVGNIIACSAWSCLDYGFKFTGGSGVAAAGGTVRGLGLSGDGNRSGHIYMDGSLGLDLFSPKAETRVDAADKGMIVIGGTGTGANRARLTIHGGRYQADGGGGVAGGALVTIDDTAEPSINIFGMQAISITNYLLDNAKVETIATPGANGYDRFIYGQTSGITYEEQFTSTHNGNRTFQSKRGNNTMVHRYKSKGNADYEAMLQIAFAEPRVALHMTSADNPLYQVRGDRAMGHIFYFPDNAGVKPCFPRVPNFTVATLPAAQATETGSLAYATNGRKAGEGGGAGTGVLCYSSADGAWKRVDDGTTVLA